MAETDSFQTGKLGNDSSSSFVYNIPLQQLRALARAANRDGCSVVGPSGKQPRLTNVLFPSSSCAFSSSTLGEHVEKECSADGNEKGQKKDLSGRTPSGQHHYECKVEQSQGRLKNATNQRLKKNSNKKLPAEVSNRRPHYATGQPLVRSSMSASGGVEPSTSTAHISAKNAASSSSSSRKSGISSRGSSTGGRGRKRTKDAKRLAAICDNRQDGVWRDHSPARPVVCLEEAGKKEHVVNTAAIVHESRVELPSEETTHIPREGYVPNVTRQQQVIPEEPLGLHRKIPKEEEHKSGLTLQGTAREIRLSRIRQEREAAVQRHLKSLRSLRMRMAAGGKGVARHYALRVGREVRDPRFSEACGPLNLRMVGRAYAFLDDMRKKEAEQLQRFLKKGDHRDARDPSTAREERERAGAARWVEGEKEAAQKALQRLRSQEEARKRKGVELVVKGRMAQEEKARIAQTGKKPFFVRHKEMKRLVQEEWQKTQHRGSAPGRRRTAKQEEKKARNKLAKERRLSAVPLRRSFVETSTV